MYLEDHDLIRLLVADDDPEYRERIRQAFEGHPRIRVTALAQSGRDAIGMARDGAPDAALIDLGLVDMSGLDVAEQVARVSPGTVVFIATDNPSMDLYRRAMALGVRQVFTKNMTAADIAGMIEQEVDAIREEMRRQAEKLPLVAPGSGPLGRFGGQGTLTQVQSVRREVIAVASPKGGVGKTTTAVNMACAAAAQASLKVKVAIVDLNEFGCVTIQMNMGTPEKALAGDMGYRNILNWQYISNNPSPEEVQEFMFRHVSGVWVVPAVPLPEKIAEVNQALITKVISILRNNFDLVVIDLPPSITLDVSWAATEAADHILIVVTPDVQVIPGMNQLNTTLRALGVASKCYRIVNRYNIPGGLKISELDRYVPYPSLGVFPDEPGIMEAIKRGEPFVLSHPQAEFSLAVKRALNQVFPVFLESLQGTSKRKRGFLGLFKKRFA